MKAKDIKPGMVLAWKPRYGETVKVRVVGPGETKGYKFSYQGPYSQKGWQIEAPDDAIYRTPGNSDADGNLIALGRELLGPWDEYVAQEAEALAADNARRERENAESLVRVRAAVALETMFKGYGLSTDTIRPGRMDFDAVELLTLLTEFRSAVKENE
jgi:hypothetical protein